MKTAYELVKAHYEANDRHDIAGMIADIADDCRWTEMEGFPCAGTYIGGPAVVENVFKALGSTFDDYTFTLERLLDAGSSAIGLGTYTGTHKKTGKSFSARVAHVWGASGGKIRSFEQFTDTLRVAQSMV
ncbi:nuclear transport factor 2 family protein [Mesorhizobium sp. NZP2077]|uniref:nuclear transport factor 2 family protein n=1 Tax=Mesorhizobium sp. NZP2077 TaxID=2483404 RepID=UPI0015571E86|nr:nuclear transport factor 2 family protein [Mesorhizobium sp. NZP2077]QKD20298.1 nuclear transport factor 2 family protein [Mesorhizobium sp. NZP2077]